MENIAWFTMKFPNLQIRIDEQRRIVAYLDGLQAKVTAAGVTVRERGGVVRADAVRVGLGVQG